MLSRIGKFTQDNSPVLLTVVGVSGVVTTAVLSGRAAVQASDILREQDEIARDVANVIGREWEGFEPREVLDLTWKLYIPPVTSGVLTISAIVAATYVGNRRAAALAAAYAISDHAFTEYREKIVEKLGPNKERKARDEIAQERVLRDPANKTEVIVTGLGDVLCYEAYAGRYFRSSMEALRRAQNEVNHQVINGYYASLSDFYDRIGLSRNKLSDEVGWNVDHLLELNFSTVLSDDEQPCIAVDFNVAPIRGYHRIH